MNYNPDLGRGLIGDSRPGAFGPRALKRPRAKRAWSGIADQAPALGLDCIYITSYKMYACLSGNFFFVVFGVEVLEKKVVSVMQLSRLWDGYCQSHV